MFARPSFAVTARVLLALVTVGALACSSSAVSPAASANCLPGSLNPACANQDAANVDLSGDATPVGKDATAGTEDNGTTVIPGTDTVSGPVAKVPGYAASELGVRIVGPSGRGHAVVSGAIAEVSGVVFGGADSVTWQTTNGASGSTFGAPFFQSDPITLTPGDNVVTITAKNATQTATDSIIITYNPAFSFHDRLHADPRVLTVNKATAVHAIVSLGKAANIVLGSVKLFRVDDAGNTTAQLGSMVDDGDLATSGDAIKQDGNYTKKVQLKETASGRVRLRASVQVQSGGQTYTAFTDIVEIDAVAPVTGADCDGAVAAIGAAKAAATAAGGGTAGQIAAIAALKADPTVDAAGPAAASGSGAWVRFKTGLLGTVAVRADGNRGGSGGDATQPASAADLALTHVQVQSKRALLLDPFATTLGADEVAATAKMMADIACPAYTVDSAKNGDANMRYYRDMYNYGVIAMATHGDAYFGDLPADIQAGYGWKHVGAQEVLWTGHKITCSYFGSAGAPQTECSEIKACGPESECFINANGGKGVCVDHLTADLRRGRVVFGSDGTYGITPAFIRQHAEDPYPRSMIYLGACRSMWNGTMASELFAAGAAAIAGFNGYVANEFATKWGTTFFSNLISQKQLSGVAYVQIEDALNPGTSFTMVGAHNLDAAYSDLINSSWETGNIQGWIRSGDGRVISKLGAAVPVAGKFMGIVSTGLGYSAQNGELKQKFCIPAGKNTFSFWWKYYSEEFKEYCGSAYQDEFLCRLEGKVGQKTVVDAKVDDLCDKGKLQAQYKIGLTLSDIGFDQSSAGNIGVYMTPWINSTADVTPFAGNGNVTLRLFTTDVGDSIYDTAVLLDKVEIQ